MANEKKVLMKHSLAKALLAAGIEHFDSGGSVGNGQTTQGGIGGFLTPQNTFQVTAPNINQQNLNPAIQQSMNRNATVFQQQQNLAQALLNQANGGGPNPALNQLNQSTGNTVANAAALAAGVRGANANPGLVARQAAMAGANAEQQAAGQAATLSAEQELGAQNQLAGLYGNEGTNALQEENILQGANASQNSALTTGQLGAAQINASAAQNNANNAASTTGGLLGSVGSALSSIFYEGGEVPGYADGGVISYASPMDPRMVLSIDTKDAGVHNGLGVPGPGAKSPGSAFSSSFDGSDPESLGVDTSIAAPDPSGLPGVIGAPPALPDIAPTFGSTIPTGQVAAPSLGAALALSQGGPVDFRTGGPVPGKARFPGKNDPKNDTVPAMLTPGEDVLPLSVTQAPNAPERAKRFVQALMDKKGEGQGFEKVLKARGSLKDRVARLEKMCGGGMAA